MHRRRTALAVGALAAALAAAAGWSAVRPSNARDWSPDQAVLPHAEVAGRELRVRNIRNVRYETTDRYRVAHYDATFDLDALESAWFLVEPFPGWRGPAHTLVSFGFRDGRYLAISVEIRKERGERFNPLLGLLKRYELMYVVADERDVVRLRTNFRRDTVYLYPARADAAQREALLLGMLARANRLRERPEFYNTLTNNCTTNIVRHVNEIAPRKVPWSVELLLPAYADELAWKLGLLAVERSPAEGRERYRINELALRWADDPAFSRRIRGIE